MYMRKIHKTEVIGKWESKGRICTSARKRLALFSEMLTGKTG